MSDIACLQKDTALETVTGLITESATTLRQSMLQDSQLMAQQLRCYFREDVHSSPKDFYDKAFAAFSERYTTPNVAKNMYVLHWLSTRCSFTPPRRIIDVGAGPGTFTLSYLSWLCARDEFPDQPTEIYMLDATPAFFDLFDKAWDRLPTRHKCSVSPIAINHFVSGDFSSLCDQPDLIVFSNSLSEMLCTPQVDRDALIATLIDASVPVMIVDYPYPNTLQLLRQFTKDLSDSHHRLHRSYLPAIADLEYVDLGSIDAECTGKRGGNEQRNVKFVFSVLEPGPVSTEISINLAEVLVRKYQEAWESHDCELLAEIFNEDAIYSEKEDQEPFRGLAAICDYWRENAQKQSHVSFIPLSIECTGDRIDVTWECRFYRKDLQKWMHLAGTFQAGVLKGRISTFIEEFSKRIIEAPNTFRCREWTAVDASSPSFSPAASWSIRPFGRHQELVMSARQSTSQKPF